VLGIRLKGEVSRQSENCKQASQTCWL